MTIKGKKLAVLGAGKLGETLISGMLDVGVVSRDRIVATAKHQERLDALKNKYRIGITTNNRKAVKGASIVLLAVKPQAVQELLEEIRGEMLFHQFKSTTQFTENTKVTRMKVWNALATFVFRLVNLRGPVNKAFHARHRSILTLS